MKIAGAGIAAFLRKPDPNARAVLVYGPDIGMVRERAEMLCRTVVDDLGDPFRVAELTGAILADDPARLADEAAALALTGRRRVVRVRDATDAAAEKFARWLAEPVGDALVVVEAGDLGPRSSLRTAFESSAAAAALPCYVDEGASLERFIVETLKRDGLTGTQDALRYLCDNLGNDRQLCRRELEKLALYVGKPGAVSLEDAMAVVGDIAGAEDDMVYACAAGDQAGLARALDRAFREGASPIALVRAALMHFRRLHLAAGAVASGASADQAMRALRPPVFFKRVDAFRAQLRLWPLPRAARALDRLFAAEIECKSTGLPAQTTLAHALMEIASLARQAGRG